MRNNDGKKQINSKFATLNQLVSSNEQSILKNNKSLGSFSKSQTKIPSFTFKKLAQQLIQPDSNGQLSYFLKIIESTNILTDRYYKSLQTSKLQDSTIVGNVKINDLLIGKTQKNENLNNLVKDYFETKNLINMGELTSRKMNQYLHPRLCKPLQPKIQLNQLDIQNEREQLRFANYVLNVRDNVFDKNEQLNSIVQQKLQTPQKQDNYNSRKIVFIQNIHGIFLKKKKMRDQLQEFKSKISTPDMVLLRERNQRYISPFQQTQQTPQV